MLSNNIKWLIKDRELTQRELAEQVFVHVNTVQRWCSGETEPHASDLYRLAKYFDINMESLMEDDYERFDR
jgi:transcriptional regulator with XRE-family HTH domain